MKNQHGNTLIELLIATFIVGMVLTGVAISLTYSIQREAISRYREGATSMAQEISEYFLLERAQQGWRSFADGYSNGTYCYDASVPEVTPQTTYPSVQPCAVATTTGMDFSPSIEITKVSPSQLHADITISWEVDTDVKTYVLKQDYFEREY
ncbi:prepilin-type N-terminal cleavage/methylation domain-containing protein [Candidatus Woesebacteria bacterium]|nr:prepilin-type N-terminal cleavage/methylation domain-containing protein [Candidatus Woesebacteria bacterium]